MENVLIVGGGPAGYTAALYAARADLRPFVAEGFLWGGLLQQTTDVENFPGFPQGILGPELMSAMRKQALRFGANLVTEDVTELELDPRGRCHRARVGDKSVQAKTVILAMGAEPHKLGVPGEETFGGRGVSYCATCDAAFFRDAQVVVVGGGDSAMEEALFLTKFAQHVTLVHRRDQFRASRIMLARAQRAENLELLTPYAPTAMLGDEQLRAVQVRHADTGESKQLAADGCFVAIGHRPVSELVAGQLPLDRGYVLVNGRSAVTSVPGVFACGDLTDPTYRQAVTAAGSGCQAALDAERYLSAL